MRKTFVAVTALFSLICSVCSAAEIKVGIIGPFSGPFSVVGKNFKAGIEAYQALNGKTVDGNEITFVYRDLEGPDPAKGRALALELITKEKVQYLAGLFFTPEALAIAPLLEQSRTPLILFNAATSVITEKSPFIVRTSFTMAQVTVPMAQVATQEGIKRVIIAVSDYAPGIDAEKAFKEHFEKAGGTVLEVIRMPLQTTDFSPLMQRIRDGSPQAVFAFLPSGPPTLAFMKAYIDAGLRAKGVQLLSLGALTQESDLAAIGDAGLGVRSTWHYSLAHDSTVNKAFLDALRKVTDSFGEMTFPAVGAYDGVHVIYAMVRATRGKQDPDAAMAAVKGLSWESPRGPVTIDPKTRHVRQTIYLREIAKDGNKYINRELKGFPDQPDYGLTSQ